MYTGNSLVEEKKQLDLKIFKVQVIVKVLI